MSYSKKDWNDSIYRKHLLQLIILLVVLWAGTDNRAVAASEDTNIQNYKQISTLEYSGKGQFVSQVETNYVVEKKNLSDNRVRYAIFPDRSSLEAGQVSAFTSFSFIIDKSNRNITAEGEDSDFWAKVHNETVKSLKEVTKNNIGVTWIQSVNLSSLKDVPFEEINFTLTAIQVRTDSLGDMIAVRALSEPFIVKISNGFFRARINTVYLFDINIEDAYLSVSVFEASTSTNKINETLRHEVVTCETDDKGIPLSLSAIGRDFERFVGKVGLRQTNLEVTEETSLPQWVQSIGLRTVQIANICSAAVCEGALNPVALISMPTVRILELQRDGTAAGVPILQRLINGFGWNWPTVGVVGAAIAIPIALSGGGGGGGGGVASPH